MTVLVVPSGIEAVRVAFPSHTVFTPTALNPPYRYAGSVGYAYRRLPNTWKFGP